MRELLTIGELSKLLDTSTYNIRYYEKEGLVEPAFKNDKGYRLYDYAQLTEFYIILLLRESNVPIKGIKELLEGFNYSRYQEALDTSAQSIKMEIERLLRAQKEITRKQMTLKRLSKDDVNFETKRVNKRVIYHVNENDYTHKMSIKELYELYQKKGLNTEDIYKKDDYYILTMKSIISGFIDRPNRYDIESTTFPKGSYLCYTCKITDDSDYDKHYQALVTHLIDEEIDVMSEILVKIDPISIISSDYYYAEYQVLVGVEKPVQANV